MSKKLFEIISRVMNVQISQINERAKMQGIKKVKAQYIKTKKNKPAENFLSDFGFIRNGDVWVFETTKSIKKPEHLVIS